MASPYNIQIPKPPKFSFAGQSAKTGKNKRRRPRLSIQELNARGVDAVREKWPELEGAKRGLRREIDKRSSLEKVFDFIDVPRNIVANIIGGLAGVDRGKLPRATGGLPRVMMSDVLSKLGIKNAVARGVLGFIGDVAIDPLTYLSAGALTGKAVARGAPRVYKAGQGVLKNVVRLGAKAPQMTANLAPAFRGLNLAKMGWREVGETLFKRASTLGDDVGDAARLFFRQYGVKGRHVGRIPFTQIMTPAMKVGKQAARYRNVAEMAPEGAAALRKLTAAQRTAAKATEAVKQVQRPSVPITLPGGGRPQRVPAEQLIQEYIDSVQKTRKAPIPDSLKAKLRQQIMDKGWQARGIGPLAPHFEQASKAMVGKATATAQQAGAGVIQARAAKDMPAAYGAFEKAAMGTSYNPKGTWGQRAMYHLTRLFGRSPNPLRQKELAIYHGQTLGRAIADTRVRAAISPMLDDFAATLAKQGLADGRPAEARRLIGFALDLGSPENIKNLRPEHQQVVAQMVKDLGLDRVFARPEYAALKSQIDTLMGQWSKGTKRLGLNVGEVKGLGKYSRTMAPLSAQQAASQGYAANRGEGVARSFWQEFTHKTRPAKTVLNTSKDDINQLLGQGYKASKRQWPASALELERGAQTTGMKHVFGRGVFKPDQALYRMDPAVDIGRRGGQQAQYEAAAKMRDLAGKTGVRAGSVADPDLAAAGMRKVAPLPENSPLAQLLGEGNPFGSAADPRAYPRPVADMLDRFAGAWREGDKSVHAALKATDHTLRWFKRWALYHPAYVIRNVWDAHHGMLMVGGNPVRQAKWAWGPKVGEMLKAIDAGDLGKLTGTVPIKGRQAPMRELAQFFMDYNAHLGGRSVAEFTPDLLRGGGQLKSTLRSGARAGKGLTEAIRAANTTTEVRLKMGTWLTFLESGFSPREAMMKTLLAMPDLSDVTAFERTVMTRIWPWYRWMRVNGGRLLGDILPQNPEWLAAANRLPAAVEGLSSLWRGEAATVPQELRPEWMREAMGTQVAGGEKEGTVFLLQNWFPFEDVNALMTMMNEPGEGMRRFVSGVRPGMKFAIETAAGQDLFRRRPIEKFTLSEAVGAAPSALMGGSGTPLDNLLAIRPLREYGRRVWEQPTVGRKVSRALIGGALQSVSKAGGMRALDYETGQKIAQLRSKIARATENKDSVEARRLQDILRQFMALQQQRMQLGLQVPKASQRAMQQAGLAGGAR